uniref:Uncharacterized protein n=1 Tax=viral metagenome TaxID=1070528 RepID=A0A6M3LGD1_9ZZZZ
MTKANEQLPKLRRKLHFKLSSSGRLLSGHMRRNDFKLHSAESDYRWHYAGGSYAVRPNDEWEYNSERIYLSDPRAQEGV